MRRRMSLLCMGVGLLALACSKKGGSAPEPPVGSAPVTAAAATSAGAVSATSAASAAPPPPDAGQATGGPLNVLMISIDSMRADMPWAGYDRAIAPHLVELHERSVSYTRGYAVSSFTSKSVAGMLTGRYPSELRRTGVFFTKYLDKGDFFCTALGRAGVPCVAGHAHAYMGPGLSGFESGFDTWRLVDAIPFDYNTDPYVTSHKLTPLAIEIVDEAAKKPGPFFAWFHYMDPHDKYQPHEEAPHFGKRARDIYDEEVFYTDLWIGKLLDHVKAEPWGARTAIVVTADHGEAFGEHGMTKHAHEVWEELVHVPLFFAVPGVAPRKIDTPRSHVDLAPTIMELLGQKPTEGLPGTSLVAELRGADAPARDVIIDLPEDKYNERRRALVRGHHKLIAFGNDARFSLFDLAADPREADDLYKKQPELAAQMRDAYREASKKLKDLPPVGGIPPR
ncbi:MAG: sulfatase [Polyangiaceae bacterium]